MQKLRSTVCEGVFGQAKTLHGMARSKFRGLSKVEIQFLLTATAINLKRIVKMLDPEVIKSEILNVSSYKILSFKRIFENWFGSIALGMP